MIVEKPAKEIELRINSLTSEWWDLQEAIEKGDVKVVLEDGAPDDGHLLIQQLRKESTLEVQNGLSLRWAVGCNEDQEMELYLQSLPMAGRTIR